MENNTSLADKISQEINSKKISMRPRAYFVAGSVALGVGLAAAAAVTAFFIGVVVFHFRVHTPLTFLDAGQRGFGAFIQQIPWLSLVVAVVGISGGLYLMRRFHVAYHYAFWGIAVGFITTVAVSGIIIDATGVPGKAREASPLKSFFQQKYSDDYWIVGVVEQNANGERLQITVPGGESVIISITEKTRIVPPIDIVAGEVIRVIGDREENFFEAEYIRHGPVPRGGPFHYYPKVKGEHFGPGSYAK
ncbi:MAG: hypothetical protein Q8Q20_01200 [bacterium]|nr:hypothetical protein [bacterium]